MERKAGTERTEEGGGDAAAAVLDPETEDSQNSR
jgi:hypothetical protein